MDIAVEPTLESLAIFLRQAGYTGAEVVNFGWLTHDSDMLVLGDLSVRISAGVFVVCNRGLHVALFTSAQFADLAEFILSAISLDQ